MKLTTGWFENHPRYLASELKIENSVKNLHQLLFAPLYHRFWYSLTRLLLGSAEPCIWQVRDRSGNCCWRIYDPVTNQAKIFTSENEVRIWLEKRY